MTTTDVLVKDLRRGDVVSSLFGRRFKVSRLIHTGEWTTSKRGREEEIIEVVLRPADLTSASDRRPQGHYWHSDRPITVEVRP